jgi:hypothetical protein
VPALPVLLCFNRRSSFWRSLPRAFQTCWYSYCSLSTQLVLLLLCLFFFILPTGGQTAGSARVALAEPGAAAAA